MLTLLFSRPIATLLAVAGATVFAPVIFPIIGAVLKPLVRPVTNLCLDLADEIADAYVERQEHKGLIKTEADQAEKRQIEAQAEKKAQSAETTAAVETLVE